MAPTLAKWVGPALAGLGIAGIAIVALQLLGDRALLARWILSSALAPERVLPLLGLGAALSLAGRRQCLAGALLFAGGIAVGLQQREPMLSALALIPHAPRHHFLTGPIASVASGLPLVAGARLRHALLPIAAILVGIALALAIKLSDPSLHDPTIVEAGVVVGVWIVGAACLTLRAFRRGWFDRAAPILGSWLIAIGLLYGGASLVPGRADPPVIPSVPDPAEAMPPLDFRERGTHDSGRPTVPPEWQREP